MGIASRDATMLSTVFRRLARASPMIVAASATALTPSMCETANIENLGESVKAQSVKQAHEMYKQAAELGDLDAMYRLGQNYQRGVGTTKDIHHASELFEAAANKGHPQAMYALAILYLLGRGVEKDRKRAQELAKKAASLGSMEAQAAMSAGNLFTDAKADFGRGRLSAYK